MKNTSQQFILKVLIILSLLIASKAMGNVSDTSIYYRPFDFSYANQGGKQVTEDDTTIINAFKNFPEKPTMITDVLLNTAPDSFASFISSLQAITPNLFFALGKPNDSLPKDSLKLITLATEYAKYTNCIRIDQIQSLVINSGDSAVIHYLTELHNLGFQNILFNSWKNADSGISWPYVNATMIAIDTTTWQPHIDRIQAVLTQAPNVTVLVNYENAPQQQALDSLGSQGSINAMAVAADAQDTSSIPYRWMPPWSKNYDPYQLNTLSWIANKLAEVDPVVVVEEKSPPEAAQSQTENIKITPNPFTQTTLIKLLNKRAIEQLSVQIYDLSGKLVKSYLISQLLNVSITEVTWDGKDNQGQKLKSGIYFVKLVKGNYKETKKLVLIN